MMLDMKRTFDEVVESQASPEKAAQILANPFYVAVSSSFAGTQEYMAMEKLGQLDQDARRTGRWDLIVVDTPPSRSALDFLDAPERLAGFLDGRFMRLLLAPAKGPARLMTAGFGLVTNALTRIIGAQVLRDMQTFAGRAGRKPPNSVSNAATNVCMSRSTCAPRTLVSALVTIAEARPSSAGPGRGPGASSSRMNRPSRKLESRSGASRKSSADRDGGVSTTIRS